MLYLGVQKIIFGVFLITCLHYMFSVQSIWNSWWIMCAKEISAVVDEPCHEVSCFYSVFYTTDEVSSTSAASWQPYISCFVLSFTSLWYRSWPANVLWLLVELEIHHMWYCKCNVIQVRVEKKEERRKRWRKEGRGRES